MPVIGLSAPDNWLERWFMILEALPDVRWVETGFLEREQLKKLARRLRETDVSWGVHFPLIKDESWSALVEQGHSPEKRRKLRGLLRDGFLLAAEMGASYLNLHLPFYMRGVPDADFRAMLGEEIETWAELGSETGQAVHLENARLRPGVFETAEDFTSLCRSHPGMGLCLDLGHLFGQVAEGRFQRDQVDEFIEEAAPFTAAVHVYQFRVEDITLYEGQASVMRCPVVPGLSPAGGWADLPRMLNPVMKASPDALLILEHGYGQGVAAVRAEIDALVESLEG